MVCSLSSLRFTDSVNAWDCSISLSKGTSDPILFPKNLLWECMYSKYTKTTLNTQRFLLHQTTHCPSCHWCKVKRHAERDPPPAKKLFACWTDYWRQESILMMAGDTQWVVLKAHQAAWSADLRADSLCFAPRNDSTGTDYNKPNIGCACHTMSDSRCILKDK